LAGRVWSIALFCLAPASAHGEQRRASFLSDRLGEAAALTGIDLGERKARFEEAAFEAAMIGARRLMDDPRDDAAGEPF
jgi:hypothetical protein